MKKYILLLIITIGLVNATEYRLTHLKRGTNLNVRMEPIVNSKTAIGYLPYNAIGIKIRECKYNKQGQEWCYINYPIGGEHIEGWISRRFLKPMSENSTSIVYIKNFLKNFYKADEENFLDKLQVFYSFPMQQYFYKKNLNLMQLRTQKVLFYKKWFKRNFNMTYLKILKRRRNYIDVQTTVRWRLKNWKEEQSGKDIQKVRLVRDNGKFKVLAIKNLRHFVDPKVIEAEENNDTNLTVPLTDTGIHFYIKIGSFFSYPNKDYLSKVTQNGFNYIIQNAIQDGNIIKRLYIGPYNTEEEAIEELS
ncbi:MAG TPA: SPOR domain-containing protein, partial [Campylobacterales bacterium]|nr:SPOR domain-containing protein [Campylobacterales bacterium]